MIENGDDGLKIAQRTQAVVAALEKTKTLIVTDRIEHHLAELVGPLPSAVRGELARLGELARYLQRTTCHGVGRGDEHDTCGVGAPTWPLPKRSMIR